MDEEQAAVNPQESESTESQTPRRSFLINKDNPPAYGQKSGGKNLGKKILIVAIIILILLAGAYLANKRFQVSSKLKNVIQPTPVATATPVPTPIPTTKPALDKSEWSLEILNGSGITGAAKKVADKVQSLGYPVIKTGNADKETYRETEILVKKELKDKIDLVIADLKDTVKIASVAGELKDSTASARIILGKDAI